MRRCSPTARAFAPDAINLDGPNDGQKADEIGPDEIEDGNDGQGQEAQAEIPIRIVHGQPWVKDLERPEAHCTSGRGWDEGNDLSRSNRFPEATDGGRNRR